ncbi:MAG: hypothetical protein RL281_1734, partial [Pseudomonadota bacterium]
MRRADSLRAAQFGAESWARAPT